MIRILNRNSPGPYVKDRLRIYVGRPTNLGNPFIVGRHGNREQVVERYRRWLDAKLADPQGNDVSREFSAILELHRQYEGRIDLECWCSPLLCHANVIREAIEFSDVFDPSHQND